MWCSVQSQPRLSGWSGGHLICQQGWTELGALHVCWLCLAAVPEQVSAPTGCCTLTSIHHHSSICDFHRKCLSWGKQRANADPLGGLGGDRACQSEFVTGETGEAGASVNTARPAESGQQFSGNYVHPMADNSTGTIAPSTESPSGCGPWQRWGAAIKGPGTQYPRAHWEQCYTEFSHLSQISCPLDTVCSQTPSHHGLGIHYSFMGEERSNTRQKLERVKWSGHRLSLQRFFRKLFATVPGAGHSVIMFSQICPIPIFTAKILINLKETLHCKVGTPAPQCATLHCRLWNKPWQAVRAGQWEKALNTEPELSNNAATRELLRKAIIDSF